MKNKKTIVAIISVIALILVIIGVTYAYWLVTKTQTNQNKITTGCLDITIDSEANDITLTNQFPLSDEDGLALTPYEFTVTNNCTTSVDYQINLESLDTADLEEISAGSIKIALFKEGTDITTVTPALLSSYEETTTTVTDALSANKLLIDTLAGKSDDTEEDTVTYNLLLWIDADAPISEQSKGFTSKISVTVGQGIEVQMPTLASTILTHAQENNYLYSTTPTFGKETKEGEYGLYQAQDNLGTSYYFRGDVDNNYVQFGTYAEDTTLTVYVNNIGSWERKTVEVKAGSPMYWRIVRINGDGTIRLIYDGTEKVANGVEHTATIAGTSYNVNHSEKCIGYTYDVDGTQTDSTIKGVIDAWYEANLKVNYDTYIEDGIFCNDRSGATTDEDGFTYYASYYRLSKAPILTCTRKEDRYTKEDTTNGNGLLKNPVGLITADEAFMAGGTGASNNTYYLYSGEYYWTSTPDGFDGDAIVVWLVVEESVFSDNGSDNFRGARPVINLKSNVLFEGKGTIDSPYEIITE